jgi:HK97 gp10 family phage protein
MASSNITVDCTSVMEMFQSLGTDVKDKAIRAALLAGANIEQEEIRENCPTRIEGTSGTALPVGALQSDVIIKASTKSADVPYVVVTFGKYSAHVARWVEDGHKIVKGKKDTGKETQPNPFISTAFETCEQAVIEAIEETFINNITKAANKAK